MGCVARVRVSSAVSDLLLAAGLAALGLLEIWLPMESVMGDGSPVVSSIGVLWFAAHMTQRRRSPWLALAGLLVWPILGLAQDGQVQVLFFGQLVPVGAGLLLGPARRSTAAVGCGPGGQLSARV